MTIQHHRPAPWRGQEGLNGSKVFADQLEKLLQALQHNSATNSAQSQTLRHDIHAELESGSGVIHHYSPSLAGIAQPEVFRDVFNRLCLWLGVPAPINKSGDYLKEVADTGLKDGIRTPQRGHLTNQELKFHCDRSDLTILACWSSAAKGGTFRVRSAADVVSSLEQRSARLYELLRQPLPHDMREEGTAPVCYMPLLDESDNAFVFRFIRKFNESVVRHGLSLKPEQVELLDEVEKELNLEDAYAEVNFRKGTIVILNNHTTLHMRTNFEDDPEHRRCLLRCWLSSEFTRPLPDSFRPVFHFTQAGSERGGIR